MEIENRLNDLPEFMYGYRGRVMVFCGADARFTHVSEDQVLYDMKLKKARAAIRRLNPNSKTKYQPQAIKFLAARLEKLEAALSSPRARSYFSGEPQKVSDFIRERLEGCGVVLQPRPVAVRHVRRRFPYLGRT